ncbi:MAG: hypothetical protein CV087_15175 [Candidatus Brocadia sp. WS118]|nr:MAG: hypothetical protein CV087_15175 [Candidatus Brocadia sp. WS118]
MQHISEPATLEPGWASYVQGLESLGQFELDKAIESFTAACAQATQNKDYPAARALTLLLQQRFTDGRAEIDRVLASGHPTRLARAIGAFAAALAGDRAGMLTYPSPRTDFEWLIFRLGENLTSLRQPIPPEEAVKQFPKVAAEFAKLQMKEFGDDKSLLARGLQYRVDNNYAAAVADLAEYLGRNPDDLDVHWYYAAALTGAGNFDRARRELSIVLCRQPVLFEGYCQRAIAAARMGNLARAKEDLAIARQLDAKSTQWLSVVEKVIDETKAVMPSESSMRLFENLLDAARMGCARWEMNTRVALSRRSKTPQNRSTISVRSR